MEENDNARGRQCKNVRERQCERAEVQENDNSTMPGALNMAMLYPEHGHIQGVLKSLYCHSLALPFSQLVLSHSHILVLSHSRSLALSFSCIVIVSYSHSVLLHCRPLAIFSHIVLSFQASFSPIEVAGERSAL